MRIGYNPHKDKENEGITYFHQIVIPVYIPNLNEYFLQSLEILKLSLNSIFKTINTKTFITIINNGSCLEVKNYLDDLFNENKIHELIHSENIGKLNSILKGIAGTNIPLITIADADVLFLNGWQNETYKVFSNFNKAGVVGLTPQFKSYETHCGNILFEKLFSSELKFRKVKCPEGLIKFYESLNWNNNYNQNYLKYHLTIKNNHCEAVVGSGHFVATYKNDCFEENIRYIGYKMGGDSEEYLDKKPLEKGYWRLTTSDNFAFHMGNVKEEWMENINLDNSLISEFNLDFKKNCKISKFEYNVKNKIFVKIFSFKILRLVFYKLKRLPQSMQNNY